MSRVTTPPTAHPATQPPMTAAKIPHERIAMRAYDKWVKKGRPEGTSLQDWYEAEAELMKELGRPASPSTARQHR
jgi:hypothetical protein